LKYKKTPRKDDLISLAYMLIYMLRNKQLPNELKEALDDKYSPAE